MYKEFTDILNWITDGAFSKASANFVRKSERMTETDAEKEFKMIREVQTAETSGINCSNFSLDRVSESLDILKNGEPVTPIELRAIGEFLQIFRKTSTETSKSGWLTDIPSLFENINHDISLEMTILQTVTDKGEVASAASPELASIRKNISRTHGDISVKIDEMLKDTEVKQLLQDDFFSVREERYVLPFKSTYKRVIPGVIHNYSRTGQTAFLEPLPLLNLNNNLTLLRSREDEEIMRILKELVGKIMRSLDYIEKCFHIAAHIEAVSLKKRWMDKFNCTVPEFRNSKINIENGWYPPVFLAIGEKGTVRNSFVFNEKEKIMVVSGPNAGGKTVALKTVHAIAELALRGVPVPASRCELPFFDKIFVVLGDDQSASDGESSFSARLKQLAYIANSIDDSSLVLIDEIGSGTDPLQGGAISRAFLEFIKEKQSFALVTSHLAEVKSIALEDSAFIPVAMGFDDMSDKPTYRMVYNLVGGSNALSLVKTINFPRLFVEKLEKLLLTKESSVEPLINRLREKEKELDSKQKEIAEIEKELKASRDEINEIKQNLIRKEETFEIERMRTLHKLMELEEKEMKKRLEQAEEKKLAGKIALIKKEQETINEAIKRQKVKMDNTEGTPLAEIINEVIPGKTILYDKLMKLKGTLLNISGKKADISVQGKKITIPVERLLVMDEEVKQKASAGSIKVAVSLSEQLDVRGMMSEDALEKLETALDRAFAGGSASLTVIHGQGSGKLKSAVRSFIDKIGSRYGAKWNEGTNEEGGNSVTVIRFE